MDKITLVDVLDRVNKKDKKAMTNKPIAEAIRVLREFQKNWLQSDDLKEVNEALSQILTLTKIRLAEKKKVDGIGMGMEGLASQDILLEHYNSGYNDCIDSVVAKLNEGRING